ncbi:MAG: hypothetical protein KDK64_06650 [Chlamydiia bacterium]|nr:hypothetical protein [Chlamydiia bacterium]
MDKLTAFLQFGSTKVFNVMQSFNSRNAEAKQKLQAGGLDVLGKYKKGDVNPTSLEIQELILNAQQPFQTLEVVGVFSTLTLYVMTQLSPWPLNWACKTGMVGTAYFSYQMMKVNDEINREYYHFEAMGPHERIDRPTFVETARRLGNNMVGKSALMATVTSADATHSYRRLDTVISEMIDGVVTDETGVKRAESLEALGRMLGNMQLLIQLYNVTLPQGE